MTSNKKFIMSKSKRNIFNTCPWKFNLKYIKRIKEPDTQYGIYAKIGKDVHGQIEKFYSQDVKIIKERVKDEKGKTIIKTKLLINKEKYEGKLNMSNFIKLNENILRESSSDKYLFPVAQEKEYWNNKLGIHGIVDAIYKHYEDDNYIIMDWKTGKIKSPEDCREELAFYKLCIDGSKELLKPVKYWAMFFTKHNHLFFEKADDEICKKIKNDITAIRKLIDLKMFERNRGYWCRWCGFKGTDRCDKK